MGRIQGTYENYEYQYNWNGSLFPLTIQKIRKLGKNNPENAVNLPFNSKNGIYTARRSESNKKYSKEATLLMIVGTENRHYIYQRADLKHRKDS